MRLIAATVAALLLTGTASAKTLMLEGRLNSSIAMRQQMEFTVDNGTVQSFSFRFALPANFQSRSVSQTVDSLAAHFVPQPTSTVVEEDRFGNRFQTASWKDLNSSIQVNLGYTANVRSELSAMESRTAFPIGKISAEDILYLQSTEMVQSDNPAIRDLARQLTKGARSEYEAVSAITNHVADIIKYTFNPPKYDAIYTLETSSGNCQNFAHLNIALLRSVGIPARIVGGITLKDSWKVPLDNRSSIVQSMGQGGHAWIEVFFPDLGWLPYDPQQSRQFTSSRHIKQTHGLDSRDINDTWRGGPYLPRYSELIDGSFKADEISLKVTGSEKDPRPYIISNLVKAAPVVAVEPESVKPQKPVVQDSEPRIEPTKPALVEPKLPEPKLPDKSPVKPKAEVEQVSVPGAVPGDDDDAIKPKKPVKPLAKPQKPIVKPEVKPTKPVEQAKFEVKPIDKGPKPGSVITLGNMEFPNLVSAYNVQGNTGTRVLDKETSEYVSSQHIYAQAFYLKEGLALDKVSLAMRKFGGDGNVYIDLVRDDGGKPNIMDGVRSNLVSLDNISRKPGYYWVDFSFAHDNQSNLKPGKYWIVFRSSGDAIMNWFYIPGKPYSESDDTRSTAKGFQWQDILNFDFVFKVTGKVI